MAAAANLVIRLQFIKAFDGIFKLESDARQINEN